jgi:hypothetical protein
MVRLDTSIHNAVYVTTQEKKMEYLKLYPNAALEQGCDVIVGANGYNHHYVYQ